NHELITARGLKVDEVSETLADYFRRQEGIQAVYTRRQLETPQSATDEPALTMMRKSYNSDRCGDMAIVTTPFYLITPYDTGTSHGMPHAYDTHVPLVVMGPGIPAGRGDEAVIPQAVVPIFARAAGIAPPATAEATLPGRLRAN